MHIPTQAEVSLRLAATSYTVAVARVKDLAVKVEGKVYTFADGSSVTILSKSIKLGE